VSRAERKALDRAEKLRKEAEDLLDASTSRRADAERKAREELAEEIASLRVEMEAASRRAAEAEAQLEQLRSDRAEAEEVSDRPSLSLVPDQPGDSILGGFAARMTEDADRLLQAAREAAETQFAQVRSELEEAKRSADRMVAEAKRSADQIVSDARSEAEELLRTALAAIERDAGAATAALEEAERARQAAQTAHEQAESELRAATATNEEAEKQLTEARAEAHRLVAEAQEARQEQLAEGRSEFAAELATLRQAIDRFLRDEPKPESIDLREVSHLSRRRS
jgi:F0F1-type ATP synthase membrane subunit b/b'